jgi:hypothetical protein
MAFICTQNVRRMTLLLCSSCLLSRDEKGLEGTNCVQMGVVRLGE